MTNCTLPGCYFIIIYANAKEGERKAMQCKGKGRRERSHAQKLIRRKQGPVPNLGNKLYGGTKGGNLTQLKQTFSCSKEVAAQGGKLIHVLVLKLIKKVNRLEIKLKNISKHCHSMSLGWCILTR
jgi:hypothetical protein